MVGDIEDLAKNGGRPKLKDDKDSEGIIPRTIRKMFEFRDECISRGDTVTLRSQFLEIYGLNKSEKMFDLHAGKDINGRKKEIDKSEAM